MTDIPMVTPLPPAPQRGQDAAVFVQRADAFIDALAAFVAELNAFGGDLIDATTERVVNEAAVSYAGALDAKNLAIAARNAAQAAAASIDPAQLVHLTGDETITGIKNFANGAKLGGVTLAPVQLTGDQNVDGIKTFAKKILATLGIRINGQDLTGLTAAGKALIEAADLDAQKAILGTGIEAAGGLGALVIAGSSALAVSTSYPLGTTVAGSSLTVASFNGPLSLGGDVGSTSSGYANPAYAAGAGEVSLGLSGTWRLQTKIGTGAVNTPRPLGLWKRIA